MFRFIKDRNSLQEKSLNSLLAVANAIKDLYHESLQKSRRVAQNPSYTSNDVGERRKRKWNKWANYSVSDDENSLNENITNDPTDEPPKSFKNKSCNEKVQILNVTTIETVGSYVVHNCLLEPMQEDDDTLNLAEPDESYISSNKLLGMCV
ncbi:hypothetical protein FQA39_LY17037 [Lamprigera yunnana]|nr:hypothetical protein FQA39_LY17037 [Lamprigera yunnana]